MAKEQPDYLSYLLRLWRVSEEKAAWRASLESSRTGERIGFTCLESLFAYLRTQAVGESTAKEDWRKEQNENGQQ